MNQIFFDIETAPLPESELLAMMPEFDAPKNFKDESKIAASIAEKKAAWVEDAALKATTGKVMAIGYAEGNGEVRILSGDEKKILTDFWEMALEGLAFGESRLIGFNIHSFDLPFMVKRSWKHRIKPPMWLKEGRYWSRSLIDLRDDWTMGDRQAEGSLDSIARFFGLHGKTGSGKDFSALWETDNAKAVEYLKRDVELVRELCAIIRPEAQQ